ncbi:Deoxyribonuclease TatD [Klebsiella pneumoniae]|nr:Deoxyribonuclease TatD [Klebsiella pneumoniae]
MFDIGVNLTSSQFSRDHDEVVARALAAGVNGMLLTGTNLAESQQAQWLEAQTDANVRALFGVDINGV